MNISHVFLEAIEDYNEGDTLSVLFIGITQQL